MSASHEEIESLYRAFYERIDQTGKKQRLICCRVCRETGVPSHSTNSDICEMCFEDDFWEHFEEQEGIGMARLWVAKAKEECIFADNYFPAGSYFGHQDNSVDGLGQARFFQNKSDIILWLNSCGSPFTAVQVEVREVD